MGAVAPMVEYLGTNDVIVKRSAMRALQQLGRNPDSCIEMHRSGVVKVSQGLYLIPSPKGLPNMCRAL